MRKLYYIVAFVTLLCAASCQQEKAELLPADVVTYTVTIPETLFTKASDADVDQLIYEVWRTDVDNDTVFDEADHLIDRDVLVLNGGQKEISLTVVKDQSTSVLFWAQMAGNDVYDASDLTNVRLCHPQSAPSSHYMAFTGVDFITKGETLVPTRVELKRPVAQLNIATAPSSLTGLTLTKVETQVSGLYASYNVAAQEAYGLSTADYCYQVTHPADLGTVTVATDTYNCLATNYIGFIPSQGTNVDITYKIHTADNGTIENDVNNIPVKPNYRTNLVGDLVAASASNSLSLDAGWSPFEDGKIKAQTGGTWTEFPTLKAAVNAADPGSIVAVGVDVNAGILILDKSITIAAPKGKAYSLTGRLYCKGTCDIKIENFAFKWDDQDRNPIEVQNMTDGSSLSFDNCSFDAAGQTFGDYGFIHFADYYAGQFHLNGCTFDNGAGCAVKGYFAGNAAKVSTLQDNDLATRGICLEGPKIFRNIQLNDNKIGSPFQITASDNSYKLSDIRIENNTLSENISGLSPEAVYENVVFKGNNFDAPAILQDKLIYQ